MATLEYSLYRAARPLIRLAPLLIIGLVAYTFSNTLKCEFVYDDRLVIVQNPSIRSLRPISNVLFPPAHIWTAGRPMTGLSLALNYAADGLNPRWYHGGNVALHLLTALVLFALLRRLLRRAEHPAADGIALAATLLWAVHPLLCDAVTYATNRSEVQMGLFFLLSICTFVRSFDSPKPARWRTLSVGCALLSVLSKEVGVMLAFVIYCIDALVVSRSWKQPLKERRWYYVALLITAFPLPLQLMTASIQTVNVLKYQIMSPWTYLLLQSKIITHYLRMVVWPNDLLIDFTDWPVPQSLLEVWPWVLGLGGLVLITVYGAIRGRRWSMLGAWFFLILAPTSSLLPIAAEPGGERRMYLPAIGVILMIVLAAERIIRRFRIPTIVPAIVASLIVLTLSQVTLWRNEDFATPLQMWTDLLIKRPLSPRAHNNVAVELMNRSMWSAACDRLNAALTLNPSYSVARSNRGLVLIFMNHPVEGISDLKQAVRDAPDSAAAWAYLGWGCQLVSQPQIAEAYLRRGLEFDPANAAALEHLTQPAQPTARLPAEYVILSNEKK